jgi:hypothetical protein
MKSGKQFCCKSRTTTRKSAVKAAVSMLERMTDDDDYESRILPAVGYRIGLHSPVDWVGKSAPLDRMTYMYCAGAISWHEIGGIRLDNDIRSGTNQARLDSSFAYTQLLCCMPVMLENYCMRNRGEYLLAAR